MTRELADFVLRSPRMRFLLLAGVLMSSGGEKADLLLKSDDSKRESVIEETLVDLKHSGERCQERSTCSTTLNRLTSDERLRNSIQ